MSKEFVVSSPEELSFVSKFLIEELGVLRLYPILVSLRGDLGAGKTALVKNFCEQIGIESVTSPTFGTVNMYTANVTNILYHMDFYRQPISPGELEEILLQEGAIVFIEWLDKASYALDIASWDIQYCDISIELGSHESRIVKVSWMS